ncbi:hypothetical protein NDU88_006028 [Pleurodeles waltl]|uniref:Uncharacterized protein n=1 Tax=Pleurodeles waltl TaxID=8319 RepID=A0AAV7TZ31_PLEWA|nr:hypothetical protein NDU88_006028 [Pleurodeles waltl]
MVVSLRYFVEEWNQKPLSRLEWHRIGVQPPKLMIALYGPVRNGIESLKPEEYRELDITARVKVTKLCTTKYNLQKNQREICGRIKQEQEGSERSPNKWWPRRRETQQRGEEDCGRHLNTNEGNEMKGAAADTVTKTETEAGQGKAPKGAEREPLLESETSDT